MISESVIMVISANKCRSWTRLIEGYANLGRRIRVSAIRMLMDCYLWQVVLYRNGGIPINEAV